MGNWENNIRKVVPYTPGEQPNQTDMIKLNTNENPYPPAPGVTEVLRNTDTDALRLYPDPAAKDLVHAIAGEYGLQDDQVFVGVGSDDVLAMSFLTFFNSEKPILFPDITYSFYDVWAELFRIPYERPALDEHFHIKKEDYFRENGGIIFPNPNAPTGVSLPLSDIEDIVEHNQDVIVIVDEAYVDFGTQSALPLIEKYENLLVFRGPADGHVELQNQNNVGDIGCVDDQRCQLHAQCSTRIAGSGNCLEIDIGRNQEQIGGAHHPERMHGSVLQVGYVGINSQNQLGEQREKQCQRKYENVGYAYVLPDSACHAIGMACTDEVADQ